MFKSAVLAAVATVALFSTPAAFAAESSESVRAVASSAAAAVTPKAGTMLYSDGKRVAAIYRIASDGNPQVIVEGRLVTVPASTLSEVNGKVTTSLTKQEIGHAK